MNHDARRARNIVAGPITASRIPRWWNNRSDRIGGSLVSGFELLAARQQNKNTDDQETTIQGARSHAEADGNAALAPFNGKFNLGVGRAKNRTAAPNRSRRAELAKVCVKNLVL